MVNISVVGYLQRVTKVIIIMPGFLQHGHSYVVWKKAFSHYTIVLLFSSKRTSQLSEWIDTWKQIVVVPVFPMNKYAITPQRVFYFLLCQKRSCYVWGDVCRGPLQILKPSLMFTGAPRCFGGSRAESSFRHRPSELDQLHWLHKWLSRLKCLLWSPQCDRGTAAIGWK